MRSISRVLSREAAAAWQASGDGAPRGFIVGPGNAPLLEVINKVHASGGPVALHSQDGGQSHIVGVKGMITRQDAIDSLATNTELFGS